MPWIYEDLLAEVVGGIVAPEELRDTLAGMLDELVNTRMQVVLVPSDVPEVAARGGMQRKTVAQNPDWYRAFAKMFTAGRTTPRERDLHDTRIKRRETIMVLRRLLGPGTNSGYAQPLIELAKAELVKQREEARQRAKAASRPRSRTEPLVQPATQDELDLLPF
jgi:hypothetical protein